MTDVHEHSLAAPLASAWQVILAAQGRPGLLTGTGEDAAAVRPRVPLTLPIHDGRSPCRGFLHVVDTDADRHVATLSFTGSAPPTGTITRMQLRVGLSGTGASCAFRVQPQVLVAGVPADPRLGAALAAQIAGVVEARARAEREQPSRRLATAATVLTAALLAMVVARRRRAISRRRGRPDAGERT
jgi:hypothetical protein